MISQENRSLQSLQSELKKQLVQGIDIVISQLEQLLKQDSYKFNDFIHLQSAYNKYKKDLLYGLVSQADNDLTVNRIRQALLHLIDQLEEPDVKNESKDKKATAQRKGKMLYQIPGSMVLEKESKCVIRVAPDDIVLTERLSDTPYQTTSIRIADIMLVNLVDSSENGAFSIRAINEAEQFIDEHEFTQWMFFVKPVSLGAHSLLLKVSVIELINGKERKRDIVFEEQVTVSTTPDATVPNEVFTTSDIVINLGAAPLTSERSNTLQTILSGIKKGSRVTLLFSLLFIMSFTFSFARIADEWSWYNTKKEDDIEAYENYLEKYPSGKHREEALKKLNAPDNSSVDINNIEAMLNLEIDNTSSSDEVEASLKNQATEDAMDDPTKEQGSVKTDEIDKPIAAKNKEVKHITAIAASKESKINPDTFVVITDSDGGTLAKRLNAKKNNLANKSKLDALKNKEVKFPISKWEKELNKSSLKIQKLNVTTRRIHKDMEGEQQLGFKITADKANSLHVQFHLFATKLLQVADEKANKNKVITSTAFIENYFNAIGNKITNLDAHIYKPMSKYMKKEISTSELNKWNKEIDEIIERFDKMENLFTE